MLSCEWVVGRGGGHTWVIFDIILADGVKLFYREGGLAIAGCTLFFGLFFFFSSSLSLMGCFCFSFAFFSLQFCFQSFKHTFMSYDSILRVHSQVVFFRLWHHQLCIIVTARHGFIFISFWSWVGSVTAYDEMMLSLVSFPSFLDLSLVQDWITVRRLGMGLAPSKW